MWHLFHIQHGKITFEMACEAKSNEFFSFDFMKRILCNVKCYPSTFLHEACVLRRIEQLRIIETKKTNIHLYTSYGFTDFPSLADLFLCVFYAIFILSFFLVCLLVKCTLK